VSRNVERLQRLKVLTGEFMKLVELCVSMGGPWIEELDGLIDWCCASENPPPDVAEAFRSIQADLATFRRFVKAATARPDSSAAAALISDGEPGAVLPDRGR
jgi:hypothetical protein